MRRAGRHALTLQTQNRRMTAGDGKELDAAALRKMYKGYPETLKALRAALDRGAGVQIGARRQGVLPFGPRGMGARARWPGPRAAMAMRRNVSGAFWRAVSMNRIPELIDLRVGLTVVNRWVWN